MVDRYEIVLLVYKCATGSSLIWFVLVISIVHIMSMYTTHLIKDIALFMCQLWKGIWQVICKGESDIFQWLFEQLEEKDLRAIGKAVETESTREIRKCYIVENILLLS